MNAMTPVDLSEIDLDEDALNASAAAARSAFGTTVSDGLEHSPDDSAEAAGISDLTGAPPLQVVNNLDDYRENLKRQTAQALVLNNPELISYLQSHPLAAGISGDDWANLDKMTQESQGGFWRSMFMPRQTTVDAVEDVVGAALKGASEGLGPEPLGEWSRQWAGEAVDSDKHRLGFAATAALGLPAEYIARTISAFGGGIVGAASGAGQFLDESDQSGSLKRGLGVVTGGAIGSRPLSEEFGSAAEQFLNNPVMGTGGVVHPMAQGAGALAKQTLSMALAKDPAVLARPYLEAGQEPPTGLHPVIDKAKAELNAKGLESLDQDLANASASTTRERSPELFSKLAERMYGDGQISLSADAVLGMYGDKPTAMDDGLLGWAPGIEEQLAAARDVGSDVTVPLKDWMTRVDPEVAKALHDDTRVWPGGVTANEAKTLPEEPKAIVDEDLPTVRAGAGLEPKFSMGDRKLTLAKASDDPWERGRSRINAIIGGADPFGPGAGELPAGAAEHNFDMLDENGKPVGNLSVSPGADGKTLLVNWIGGQAGLWSNSFGPALVRDLKRQLKAEYPDHEYLTGMWVSGARTATGDQSVMPLPRVKLAADADVAEHQQTLDILQNGWERATANVDANRQGPGFYTPEEMAVGQATADEIGKLTGGKAAPQAVAGLRQAGNDQTIRGMYSPQYDRKPDIFYDLLGPDAKGIGRHESIHMLKDYGLINPSEWSTLTKAATDEGWHDRYGINDRYAHLDQDGRDEEAVAEGFREWAGQAEADRPKTGVGAVFQKIWDFLDRVRQGMGKYLGREPTFGDVFKRINSGEVGAREAQAPANPDQFRFSIEGQEPNIEGRDNLQAAAVGLPLDAFRKLQTAIRARAEEELAKAQAKAEREVAKRQSAEWKSNRGAMAVEVAREIRNRPDVAADSFLNTGDFFGEQQHRVTLNEAMLTDAQKAALPERYVSAAGADPDHVAGLFGYSSGAEMIDRVAALEAGRRGAEGATRMRPVDFTRKLVQDETDRRMEQRYGPSKAQELDDAKNQALSESSINVMHQEYMAAAQQAGVTGFSKEVAQRAAHNAIAAMPIGTLSSAGLWNKMGAHSRLAEAAMVSGDWTGAALHMQRQTMTMMMAKEAGALEGRIAKFDATAKRWAKRDQPSVPTEYGNWVHDILKRIGKPVAMTAEDLGRQIRGESDQTTFAEFVKGKANDLSALDVWEDLLNPQWGKAYKTLIGDEFDKMKDSVDTLIAVGRQEKRLIAQGEAHEFAEVRGKLVEGLEKFPFQDVEAQRARSIVTRFPRQFLLKAIQVENLLGRWDGFSSQGPWTQMVFRDLKTGDNYADAWRKEYAAKLGEAADGVDLNRGIENKIFRAPEQYGGQLIPMNRGSLRAVMLNYGNASNIEKIAKGWGVKAEVVRGFIDQHATKEDWDFAQKVWDVFDELKDKSDTTYRSMGRMAAKTIEPQAVDTAFGQYKGGYYPVIWHRDYAVVPKAEGTADALMQGGYESIYPPSGYTQARQNFFQPLAMDLNDLPVRVNQIIHDAAMRPSVVNFVKVLRDPKIKAEIITRAGRDTYDMLNDYIKGVANKANTGVQSWRDGATVSDFLRQNMMAGLVGFNVLGTAVKHFSTAGILSAKEVGPLAFARAVRGLHTVNDVTGEDNYQFAMANSLELQRRDRNYAETLYGATNALQPIKAVTFGDRDVGAAVAKFMDYRQRLLELSSKPLAFSDKLSSVPTWLAAYDTAQRDGMPHGDAVFEADRAVRRAHGSTAITSRPVIMNQLTPWLTTFYNFFNDVYNRQVETVWRAGEIKGLVREGDYKAAMKQAGLVGAGVFAYSLWPAVTENWSSPQDNDPKDGWFKRAAKAIAYTEGSTLPVVREFTNALLNAKDPDVGLFSTAGKAALDIFRDVDKKQPASPAHTEKLIRDAGELGAVLAGVPEQFSKLGSFAYGKAKGLEHPQGPWGWLVGARYGTLRGHSQTAGQYLAGQYDRRR